MKMTSARPRENEARPTDNMQKKMAANINILLCTFKLVFGTSLLCWNYFELSTQDRGSKG